MAMSSSTEPLGDVDLSVLLANSRVERVLGSGSNGTVLKMVVTGSELVVDGGNGEEEKFDVVDDMRLDRLPPVGAAYALKIVGHFSSAVAFEHLACEAIILNHVKPHPNIIRVLGLFIASIPEELLPHLPTAMQNEAKSGDYKTRIFAMAYHPQNIESFRFQLPFPMARVTLLRFARDLLLAALHLAAHDSVHLDWKLDNVLVAHDGRLVLTDFGISMILEPGMVLTLKEPLSTTLNETLLAPEVLERLAIARSSFDSDDREPHVIDFGGQAAWNIGGMLYELACGSLPFPSHPSPDSSGKVAALEMLPELPYFVDRDIDTLVRGLLEDDPKRRTTLEAAVEAVQSMLALDKPWSSVNIGATPPRTPMSIDRPRADTGSDSMSGELGSPASTPTSSSPLGGSPTAGSPSHRRNLTTVRRVNLAPTLSAPPPARRQRSRRRSYDALSVSDRSWSPAIRASGLMPLSPTPLSPHTLGVRRRGSGSSPLTVSVAPVSVSSLAREPVNLAKLSPPGGGGGGGSGDGLDSPPSPETNEVGAIVLQNLRGERTPAIVPVHATVAEITRRALSCSLLKGVMGDGKLVVRHPSDVQTDQLRISDVSMAGVSGKLVLYCLRTDDVYFEDWMSNMKAWLDASGGPDPVIVRVLKTLSQLAYNALTDKRGQFPFVAVMKLIRNLPIESADSASALVEVLRNLSCAQSSDTIQELIAAGAVESVIAQGERSFTTVAMLFDIVMAANNLLRFSSEASPQIPEGMCARVAVRAMQMAPTNAELVEGAMSLLYDSSVALGSDPEALSTITPDVYDALVDVMQFIHDPGFQEKGAYVLSHALYRGGKPPRFPHRVGRIVTKVMVTFSDSAHVTGVCSTVLCHLSCIPVGSPPETGDTTPGLAAKIAGGGVVESLHSSMELDPENSTLQQNGTNALYNLLLAAIAQADHLSTIATTMSERSLELETKLGAIREQYDSAIASHAKVPGVETSTGTDSPVAVAVEELESKQDDGERRPRCSTAEIGTSTVPLKLVHRGVGTQPRSPPVMLVKPVAPVAPVAPVTPVAPVHIDTSLSAPEAKLPEFDWSGTEMLTILLVLVALMCSSII